VIPDLVRLKINRLMAVITTHTKTIFGNLPGYDRCQWPGAAASAAAMIKPPL
jgi:hypothetical protein